MIDNINENQNFKNYKEICSYLNEPIKTGKSKILQIEDWHRYFELKKENRSFHIGQVYTTPIEKEDTRTSNNNKNIRPMMNYLLSTKNIADGQWHSYTELHCDKLKLLNKDMCTIIYRNKDIKKYCDENNISDPKLMMEYVTSVKQILKKITDISLDSLMKKKHLKYQSAYHFTYRIGKHDYGHVYSDRLMISMVLHENDACNTINSEYNLSRKMKGRQLLKIIYSRKDLTVLFKKIVIKSIMEDSDMIKILNDSISNDNISNTMQYDSIASGTEPTFINKDHPIISYHEVIRIDEIKNIDKIKNNTVAASNINDITDIVKKKAYKQYEKNKLMNFSEIDRINEILFNNSVEVIDANGSNMDNANEIFS